MKTLVNLFLGAFLGIILTLVFFPEFVVNQAIKRKLNALEYIIVDHEMSLNKLKKECIK